MNYTESSWAFKISKFEDRRAKEWTRILDMAQKNGFYEKDIWRVRERKEYKALLSETTTLSSTGEDRKFCSYNLLPKTCEKFQESF